MARNWPVYRVTNEKDYETIITNLKVTDFQSDPEKSQIFHT